jgi:hypothetical protein
MLLGTLLILREDEHVLVQHRRREKGDDQEIMKLRNGVLGIQDTRLVLKA